MGYATYTDKSFKGPLVQALVERERAEMRSIEANLPKCPGCGGIHRDASALCWGCQCNQREASKQ